MKVLLLAGGASNERAVSLTSGEAVSEALRRLGHEVYAIDPADGRSLLARDGAFLSRDAAGGSPALTVAKTSAPALAGALSSSQYDDIDIVFVALHGGAGENGVIQCLLELAGKAYTGSNMMASAISMNKAVAKRLFVSEGIATPDWELYRFPSGKHIKVETLAAVKRRFSFPLIVKPNDGGSTIGLTKVEREPELRSAFEAALTESTGVLVEQYIPGREMTVAVLEGQPLPVVEIKPRSGLYDYEAKYTKGKSKYIVPAQIDPEIGVRLQEAAAKAYNAIGCAGLVRVDFILAQSGGFYCLEVNTIPGMTSLSLAPMAAKSVGIEFDQLIERIIQSAVKRHLR